MGYRIIYLPEPKKKRVWPWMLSILVLCFVCAWLIPQGRQAIETVLIPGEPEVTRQAFANLVDTLRSGENFTSAFAQFCEELASGIG